jgi:hypothetical protein
MQDFVRTTDIKYRSFGVRLLISCVMILIVWPYTIGKVAHYNFKTGYFALFLSACLLPGIILLNRSYFFQRFTISIWALRALACVVFLAVGLEYGVSWTDLISFGGTLCITFFYELGVFIAKSGEIDYFHKCMVLCVSLICIYLLIFTIPLVFKYRLPILYMPIVRDNYHHEWPNAFSVILVLSIISILYLSKFNKIYFYALLVIFPTLFLTFCRTSFIALFIISVYLAYYRKQSGMRRLLRSIIVGSIMVILFFSVNAIKETGYHNIKGAKLIHSHKMRLSRWMSIYKAIEERPLLGVGFRSAVLNIPVIRTYQGDVSPMHSAHSDYVDLFIRGGVVYSIFFWSFVFLVIYRGFRGISAEDQVLLYASLSMVVLLVGSITQNLLKDPFTASFFWIYVSFIGYSSHRKSPRRHHLRLSGFSTDSCKHIR